MKTRINNLLTCLGVPLSRSRVLLVAAFGLMLTTNSPAQTFTVLHSFTASRTNSSNVYTNSDGTNPQFVGLILSNNILYGTAWQGGSSGNGEVFAVHTDGTGFTNLHSFTATANIVPSPNSDGANPITGLILSGDVLYGTTVNGGISGNGTVFSLNIDGSGFTTLHSFSANTNNSNSDGANPYAGLILSGDTLYGTANYGGTNGNGTVFALNTNGTGFTTLHTFTSGHYDQNVYTNSDGANPNDLILSDDILYGTTSTGGTNGTGTVFALNTNGTGFATLHIFTTVTSTGLPNYLNVNSDGANPIAGLILAGNTLYGTTFSGGTNGTGTVFAVNTDGTEFRTLHTFTTASFTRSPTDLYLNSDGASPAARLVLSGNTLYGTTESGNTNGTGIVFGVNTNGLGFTTLYSFTGVSGSDNYGLFHGTNGDGALPMAGLILAGNTLYGTASAGGSGGPGTVFSLAFPSPQLTIIGLGANIILTWPANYAGFSYSGYSLQTTTNLVAPVVWATNSSAPVVVKGQNLVTNPISGAQQFFRLSQ